MINDLHNLQRSPSTCSLSLSSTESDFVLTGLRVNNTPLTYFAFLSLRCDGGLLIPGSGDGDGGGIVNSNYYCEFT